jgi:hypothetical protein
MSMNIPMIIQRMLQRPPILVDEDRAEFCDLFELICDDEHPHAMEEWILVADIAYADWEILRLRGLKVRVFHASLTQTWQTELDDGTRFVDVATGQPLKPTWQKELRNLVIGVLAGDLCAKAAMARYLERRGLTVESLVGGTFAETISTQLSADRLVDAAYRRRSALYADLERARAKRSRDLPAAADSPSVAPGDGDNAAAARKDVNGAAGQPSSADEGQS